MATFGDALIELGIEEWVLNGIPSSESEFNQMFAKVTGEDDQGAAILSTNPDDFGVTWAQLKTKYDELNAAEPLKFLRIERNKKLAETDWWDLPTHAPMSAERTAYRQALRDITDIYSSLDTVVWPTKPV
jgi:hypothetical protein